MIIVLGASGQLGTELLSACDSLAFAHAGLTHADIEVENLASISTALAKYAGMDNLTVINTAAFHNVDACEKDGDRAFQVNCVGSQNVAQWCRQHGAKYCFVSTDFIAGTPTDASGLPLSVYAKTKLAGELAALSICPGALVVRVGTLYGASGCRAKSGGGNFIDTVVGKIKSQQPFSLPDYTSILTTSAHDAAYRILHNLDRSGVWYGTDWQLPRSHYQIGLELCNILNLTSKIMAVSHDPNDTIRPHTTSLPEIHRGWAGPQLDSHLPTLCPPLRAYCIEKGYIA